MIFLINTNFKTSTSKTVVFLFMFVLTCAVYGQKGARIGYIDTEYILENITEYQNAQNQLELKVQQWKTEVEQRYAELETQKTQLNNERVLLTNELFSEREEELKIIEDEILDYQQKRFGPNGDLMLQKKQLIQPIQDQIFAAVQEIATTKKFDFVFDKSADVVMLYSADRYDISEQVLRTINRTAKREQVENKKDRKAAEEENNIVEVDSDKDERQKLIDERNAKRAEAQAKRKEELEAKRAARKKEIEAKKQKIKEVREKARAEKLIKANRKKEENSKVKEKEEENPTAAEQEVVKEEKTNTTTNSREARKKALEEKKKRILAERKARLEAQKRKRDSIKNNKK